MNKSLPLAPSQGGGIAIPSSSVRLLAIKSGSAWLRSVLRLSVLLRSMMSGSVWLRPVLRQSVLLRSKMSGSVWLRSVLRPSVLLRSMMSGPAWLRSVLRPFRAKTILAKPVLAKPVLLAFSLLFSLLAPAQEAKEAREAKSQKQKEKVSLIGIGYTDILDTYISQEKATGPELRYVYESISRRDSSHISHLTMHQGFFTRSGTRGNDNSMLSGMYNLKFGWHYNWDLDNRNINLKAGGLVDGTLGFLYNTRNSNNPAQARASLNIDPSVLATWRFHIKDKPFALHYEAAMPLLGIAFSPNYGQSYYEIFSRGNYDHNIVFLSPFSSGIQFHQILSFDFRLWRTTFTVGYLGDIRQMEANNLKYHQYTHSFVIGWRY